jgi:hypothetical protein
MGHCGLLWKVSVSALGVGRGFSLPERVQFTHGNDELSEPAVQTNQNALANVDGGTLTPFGSARLAVSSPSSFCRFSDLHALHGISTPNRPLPNVGNIPAGCCQISKTEV